MQGNERSIDLDTCHQFSNFVYSRGYDSEKILDISYESFRNDDMKNIAQFCIENDIEGLDLLGNRDISDLSELQSTRLNWVGVEETRVDMHQVFELYMSNSSICIYVDENIADYSVLGKDYEYHESFDWCKETRNEYRYYYCPKENSEHVDEIFYFFFDNTRKLNIENVNGQYARKG